MDAGPDPERDGVVRWRRVDLKQVIRERYGVDLDETSVGRLLEEQGFARRAYDHPAGSGRMTYRCYAQGTDNLSLAYIPPATPDLNPAEAVWQYLPGQPSFQELRGHYRARLPSVARIARRVRTD